MAELLPQIGEAMARLTFEFELYRLMISTPRIDILVESCSMFHRPQLIYTMWHFFPNIFSFLTVDDFDFLDSNFVQRGYDIPPFNVVIDMTAEPSNNWKHLIPCTHRWHFGCTLKWTHQPKKEWKLSIHFCSVHFFDLLNFSFWIPKCQTLTDFFLTTFFTFGWMCESAGSTQ